MVTNETAYPFGAENTVVEENTEEISLQEDAGDDLVIEEGNESEDTQDEASTAEETEESQDEASTAEETEEAQDENETDSVEVFSDDMEMRMILKGRDRQKCFLIQPMWKKTLIS